MDPAHVFRQGLVSVAPRHNHTNTINLPRRPPRDYFSDDHEPADGPGRIAHTLTACCRCRQVPSPPSLLLVRPITRRPRLSLLLSVPANMDVLNPLAKDTMRSHFAPLPPL